MTEEQLVRAQREYERIHALLQGVVYGSIAVIALAVIAFGAQVLIPAEGQLSLFGDGQ